MTDTTPPTDGLVRIGSASFSAKELALLLPTLLAALAITYDLGYFIAMDVRLFTFFSLTEHFVFALQAVPLIIFGMLCVATLGFTGFHITHGGKIENASDPNRPTRFKWVNALWTGFVFASLSYTIFISQLRAFGALAIFLPTIAVCWHLRRQYGPPATALAVFVTIFGAFVVAFLSGLDMAKLDRVNANVRHVIELPYAPTISVRVIRAGERGVVIYDPDSKRYRLMRWDDIKSIETEYGDISFWQIMSRYFRE